MLTLHSWPTSPPDACAAVHHQGASLWMLGRMAAHGQHKLDDVPRLVRHAMILHAQPSYNGCAGRGRGFKYRPVGVPEVNQAQCLARRLVLHACTFSQRMQAQPAHDSRQKRAPPAVPGWRGCRSRSPPRQCTSAKQGGSSKARGVKQSRATSHAQHGNRP